MFKVGDKVKVLDDDQSGVVIRTHKNLITILNDFGFEETYRSTELIADKNLEVGQVLVKKEEITKKEVKSKDNKTVKEIDLHIGQLVDSYANMTNFEMLQIQLNKVRSEIELAKKKKIKKLIFIHGHGKGKLKEELMKVLKKYENINTYDASFQKYNGGATTVEFRNFS